MTHNIELERDILRAIQSSKRPNATLSQLERALPRGRYKTQEIQEMFDAMYDDGLIIATVQTPHLRALSRSYLILGLTAAGRAQLANLLAA